MTPKRPRALPKISIIKIFTKRESFCAFASAQEAPIIPTQTPQHKFAKPTVRLEKKIPQPAKRLASLIGRPCGGAVTFPENTIAMIIP